MQSLILSSIKATPIELPTPVAVNAIPATNSSNDNIPAKIMLLIGNGGTSLI